MTFLEQTIQEFLTQSLSGSLPLHSSELPNIGLYMDQVTYFLDAQLGKSRRHPEDKVLTKTMINNYAKNNLLPSPDKKRYSKDHMLLLIFIYYFKSFLSIRDIEKLLHPLIEKYFGGENGHDIAFIYDQISQMERDSSEKMKADLSEYFRKCQELFGDADQEDQDSLRQFALICLLAYDVYCKKCLIEKLIDQQN